jgi:hypothetical protein
MKRRDLIAGICAGILATSVAYAQGFADQIISQLRDQGYSDIAVSNTWLGRTRILAHSGDGEREIIIDPRTGEILRDLFTGSSGSGPRITGDRSDGNSGHGSGGDDGGDDNSGHGGGDDDGGDEDGGDGGDGGGGGSDGDGGGDD